MVKGYMNRSLTVDLSRRAFTYHTPDAAVLEEFIGGKGLGLKLMLDLGLISHDPFAPENPLIFVTGPFTGTPVQTSARSALVTKSPLTNSFLDTHAGGHFGPALKRAGLDYLIITGRSQTPVILHLSPEEVRFEEAADLWGKGIFETEKTLKKKYPRARIAAIGPV